MENVHPLFQQILRSFMPKDAMPLHDKESEQTQVAFDKAVRQVNDGDFEFDDFMEGCKCYWPQIKKCLSDRDDDEAHTFIMKGLVRVLMEKEDE